MCKIEGNYLFACNDCLPVIIHSNYKHLQIYGSECIRVCDGINDAIRKIIGNDKLIIPDFEITSGKGVYKIPRDSVYTCPVCANGFVATAYQMRVVTRDSLKGKG